MENEAKENVKKLMRECFEMARDGAYTSRGFLYEDFDEYFEDIKDEFNSVVSKRESKPDEAEHSKLTLAGVSNNEVACFRNRRSNNNYAELNNSGLPQIGVGISKT